MDNAAGLLGLIALIFAAAALIKNPEPYWPYLIAVAVLLLAIAEMGRSWGGHIFGTH